jgi:hypothetical protein
MLRARAILAGLIAILVIGDSETESKRRSTQPQIQTPSANPTQPPAPDQRGTDQVPFTIKVIPSETPKDKAEREERERRVKDEKAAIDKRLADDTKRLADETGNLATYTRWLDGITVFLFIAAVVQIALFVWQLRLIRASLDNANEATKAAREGAKAAQESADVARATSEAAIAFERPYVRVSEIKALIRGVFVDTFPNTVILRNPSATCTIENYGKTPAFIDETQAQLRFSPDDLQIILTVGKPIPVVTLRTGQVYSFNVPLGEPINRQRAEDIQSGKQYFWLHFNFVYRDVLGKTHRTPDKWKYDFSLDSFTGVAAYREAT